MPSFFYNPIVFIILLHFLCFSSSGLLLLAALVCDVVTGSVVRPWTLRSKREVRTRGKFHGILLQGNGKGTTAPNFLLPPTLHCHTWYVIWHLKTNGGMGIVLHILWACNETDHREKETKRLIWHRVVAQLAFKYFVLQFHQRAYLVFIILSS